jgi:hypothetical protein
MSQRFAGEILNHKILVIGTTLIVGSFITLMAFLTTFNAALEAINPIAALTAITVAIIGIAWFKKTSN